MRSSQLERYKNLGLNISFYRKLRGFSQEKLAEKAEIAPDYLCRIESGKKHPSLTTILLIAGALDTTVDDLLADVLKKDTSTMMKEEKSLLAGCTEKQKRFVIAICHSIKEEMIKYDRE